MVEPLTADQNFTASLYQRQKHQKHTVEDERHGIQGVFAHADYDKYRHYIINTHASGAVEVRGHSKSFVWFAGEHTGVTFVHGVPTAQCDGVKLVLADNALKIHPYPTGSSFVAERCTVCDRPVATQYPHT